MTVKGLSIGLMLVLVVFAVSFNVYALDWQRIYDRSSHVTVDDALATVKQDKTSVDALAVLGFVYLHKNEPEKAQIAFNEILRIAPDTFEARWGLAEVMVRTGDLAGGEKALSSIVGEHPDFTPAKLSWAYLKFRRKDYPETLSLTAAILDKGISAIGRDTYLRAYLLQAAALGMLADENGETVKNVFAEAVLPGLTAARELIPRSPQSYLGLGVFFLTTPPCAGGDLEKAAVYLEEAVSLDPKLADGYAYLAQVYAARGSRKNFDKFLNKAFAIDPENKTAHAARSKVSHFTVETIK